MGRAFQDMGRKRCTKSMGLVLVAASLWCSGCRMPGTASAKARGSTFQANHQTASISSEAQAPGRSKLSLAGRRKEKEAEKAVDPAPEETNAGAGGNVLTRWMPPKSKEAQSDQPPRRWPLPLSLNPAGKASEKIDDF